MKGDNHFIISSYSSFACYTLGWLCKLFYNFVGRKLFHNVMWNSYALCLLLLSVLGKSRLLNIYQPSKMDELKDRRNGVSQLSVPESLPDMDTFETIDNPHIIINGERVFSIINHDIDSLMEVLVHSFWIISQTFFLYRLATEKCKGTRPIHVLFICIVSPLQRTGWFGENDLAPGLSYSKWTYPLPCFRSERYNSTTDCSIPPWTCSSSYPYQWCWQLQPGLTFLTWRFTTGGHSSYCGILSRWRNTHVYPRGVQTSSLSSYSAK